MPTYNKCPPHALLALLSADRIQTQEWTKPCFVSWDPWFNPCRKPSSNEGHPSFGKGNLIIEMRSAERKQNGMKRLLASVGETQPSTCDLTPFRMWSLLRFCHSSSLKTKQNRICLYHSQPLVLNPFGDQMTLSQMLHIWYPAYRMFTLWLMIVAKL